MVWKGAECKWVKKGKEVEGREPVPGKTGSNRRFAVFKNGVLRDNNEQYRGYEWVGGQPPHSSFWHRTLFMHALS